MKNIARNSTTIICFILIFTIKFYAQTSSWVPLTSGTSNHLVGVCALSADNLKIIRPATGLAPKHWDEVIGKKSKSDLKAGTPLTWENM